jgi:hypothetical protein
VFSGYHHSRFDDPRLNQLAEKVETVHETEARVTNIKRDTIFGKGEIAMNEAPCGWLEEVPSNRAAEERANIFVSEAGVVDRLAHNLSTQTARSLTSIPQSTRTDSCEALQSSKGDAKLLIDAGKFVLDLGGTYLSRRG